MIKVTIASIFIASLSILGIIALFRLLKKDVIHLATGFFWIFIFLAIGVFVLFPHLLDTLASLFMMKNRIFFLVISAILVLFGLQLKQTIGFSYLERKIHKIIQENSFLTFRLTEIEKKLDTSKKEKGKE